MQRRPLIDCSVALRDALAVSSERCALQTLREALALSPESCALQTMREALAVRNVGAAVAARLQTRRLIARRSCRVESVAAAG